MRLLHVGITCSSEERADQVFVELLGLQKAEPKILAAEICRALFGVDRDLTMINYVGESHGRGLPYGLELLAAQDSRFAAQVMWTGAPEAPTDEHLGILMTRWTGASWYPFGGEEDTWTHQDAIDGNPGGK